MTKTAYKRSQTEGIAASSNVINDGVDNMPAMASKVSKRKRIKKLLIRSKSVPDHQTTQSTRSGISDDISSTLPPPSKKPHILKVTVDDGKSSNSTLKDIQRVLQLITNERHLVAYELFVDVKRRIIDNETRFVAEEKQDNQLNSKDKRKAWWREKSRRSSSMGLEEDESDEHEKAYKLLQERQKEFEALGNRAKLFTSAKENLSVDDDWIHAQTLFGISTSYRREADGSLSIKIEGELHGVPLFEQLVVLREVDLYHTWAPFMSQSKKLAQLDKMDVVAWYIFGVPMLGLTRDAVYRAVGCDCMNEDGSILIVARGLNDTEEYGVKRDVASMNENVDQEFAAGTIAAASSTPIVDTTTSSFLARDDILSTIQIPDIPEGVGKGRMTIRDFSASIDILSPTSARTKLVANIDPNLPLIPQFVIDFVMKRMAGILLARLQATARAVVNDPVKHTHSRRIREDVRFYRDFLLPRFKVYCDELGWEMPRVGAFEIEEGDLQREGMSWIDDNTQQRNQQQSGGSDGSYHSSSSNRARNISSSPSSISSKESRLRKLKRIIRRTESEEDRNAARERASQRLKPKPFSQSKVNRLNELKAAKLRAEERKAGMSSGESVSSFHSMESFQDLGAKDEVKHSMVIFTFSFTIYVTLLLLLRRGDMLEAVEPIQFGSTSLDLFMILLQSLCLWTLLNGVLIYAFERIDFGQKEMVKNMLYGKHYVATEIKRLTLLASVAIAVTSCGYGVAAKSFHWIFCLQSDGGHTDIRQPRVDLRRLLPRRSESNESAGSERAGVSYAFDAIRKSCWRIVTALGWVTSKLQMNSATRICESVGTTSQSWSSSAVETCGTITLYVGIFVLALVLMGCMILPKKAARNANKAKERTYRRRPSSRLETVSEDRSVDSSLNRSSHSFGVRGNLSSMEIITE